MQVLLDFQASRATLGLLGWLVYQDATALRVNKDSQAFLAHQAMQGSQVLMA